MNKLSKMVKIQIAIFITGVIISFLFFENNQKNKEITLEKYSDISYFCSENTEELIQEECKRATADKKITNREYDKLMMSDKEWSELIRDYNKRQNGKAFKESL